MRIEQLCVDLELTVQALTKELVKRFNEAELGYLYFQVTAEGSTTGDVRIQYKIGTHAYDSDHAKGNRVLPTLEEYMRRHGWEQRNQPLMLTFDGSGDLKSD